MEILRHRLSASYFLPTLPGLRHKLEVSLELQRQMSFFTNTANRIFQESLNPAAVEAPITSNAFVNSHRLALHIIPLQLNSIRIAHST